MGLTMFAIFAAMDSKSEISRSFSYQVESDEDNVGRPSVIHLHQGAFNDSHQLWVNYEPRSVYPYRINKWRHLRISLITNSSNTKVVSCGARLLYKHDLDKFVQTIIDSVLGSSLNLHEFYNGIFLEGMLSLIRSQRYDPDQEEEEDEDEDEERNADGGANYASSSSTSAVHTTSSLDDTNDHFFQLKQSLGFFFQRSLQVLSISVSISCMHIHKDKIIFLGKNIEFC